jgi:hypothetical protein
VGGDFLDLTGVFDGVPWQAFTDYAHLTPQANQLVAERIAREILPMIRTDRSTACSGPRCPSVASARVARN